MKKVIVSLVVGAAVAVIWAGVFYWDNLRGAFTAFGPMDDDIEGMLARRSIGEGGPLELPPGFSIEIFAKDLPGIRVMAEDSFGNWWASQTSEGKVVLLEVDKETGKVVRQNPVFTGLKKPHGLAIDPENPFLLYIAEEDKISRVGIYSEDTLHKISDLPSGSGHSTRTVGFGPDGRLYVSIGSSCNVCNDDEKRAAIYSMNPDGSDFKLFAKGLRNAVFFTWSEVDGRMWATDNGRDLLGDDIPPDEINIVEEGGNFGWPVCYGKNIHDAEFDKNTYIRNPCMEPFETPSYVDIQAHSAPLGLSFIPESQYWPEEYWYNLIVALHGSWNRTTPTGYKLIRIKLDAHGNYLGTDSAGSPQAEDFITGWLANPRAGGGDVLGRPVQVVASREGVIYVTDDKAGVIYKIKYTEENSNDNNDDDDRSNLIRVKNINPGDVIKSPLVVEGEARGYWFFEASFPVRVLDGDGTELGVGIAQAQDEWMTENFVPFKATVSFKAPKSQSGTLVFQKDNPSGLAEHDDELRIPIIFSPASTGSAGECFIGGCSGEICSDREDMASICIWREEFACYKGARCERQSGGECGWTETLNLINCLEKSRAQ